MTLGQSVAELEAEYRAAQKVWQADVFNKEKELTLERASRRLAMAKRAQGEAEGVEYPAGWNGLDDGEDPTTPQEDDVLEQPDD